VTQGFSHLASTVPDSQGLQQFIDVATSFKPLAPPTNPLPSNNIPLKKMATQSSPHDTQELSPSYYESLINVNKSKSAAELAKGGQIEDADDGVTQRTAHIGDPGHIDLGLGDSDHEDEEQDESDQELNSEPIEFSPTQATQNRLSQFPESQRFKTPATNGKKRNYLGEVIESPALPRNPLARDGATKTPIHALGLSQAFAATQACSSPIMTRHTSVPTSDRPSPNIEMQARPATASLSSPLRPRSELKRGITEPQSHYISIKQSQLRREHLAAVRQQSSGDRSAEHSDVDDDFDEEPSHIKRTRRVKEREENIRQIFARFSSPTRPGSAGKTVDQPTSTTRAQTSSPFRSPHSHRVRQQTTEEETRPAQACVAGDSEEETDVETEEQVVIRNSSQVVGEHEEEDKENAHARALQVPETVARSHQIVNGEVERDASPTLRRAFAQPAMEPLRSSQVIGQGAMNGQCINGSPTFAVENSQPDQPLSRKLAAQLAEPSKAFSSHSHVSSSAAGVTQVHSSPGRDEVENRYDHSQPQVFQAEFAREQQYQESEEGYGNASQIKGKCVGSPRHHVPAAHLPSIDENGHVQPLSTVPERSSAHGSTTDVAEGSLDAATSVKGNRAEQQSSRYESARTHLSSNTPASRLLNSLFSSPSGRKRKRLGDIAAQPSPKKTTGGMEMEEVMAATDDSEFYKAVEGAPESSSPIPPGRNIKRRRLLERQAVLSRATSASADSHLPSSPPTSDLNAVSHTLDPAPSVPPSKTDLRPSRRSEAIWDVQTSPEKSAPAKPMRGTAREPKGLSKRVSGPQKSKSAKPQDSMVAEMVQDGPDQEPRPVVSVLQPPNTSIADQQPPPRDIEVIAPNRVLACFNGNRRGYYPATCIGSTGLKLEGTFRYQIQWDDSSRDDIDEDGIRTLDLRVGDQVKVNLQGWPRVQYVIQGFKDRIDKFDGDVTDIRGFKTLLVKPKKRKSLPADISTENVKEAPMSATYLDTKMWGQMKDRIFDFDHAHRRIPLTLKVLQQAPSRSGLATPSERPSTPSTPSSRTRRKSDFPAQTTSTALPLPGLLAVSGIFSNMTFAVSYDDEQRKTSLGKAISADGGTLLGEDFHEMFDRQSPPTPPSRRAPQMDPLALNARFFNSGFVALIADRHSRKPKYMQALALGIPSLSGRWVEACIAANRIKDWQPYLLSAGESLVLEGAVRSRVLSPVDANTALLKDMISTRPNLLQGEAAIVVKGRGKAEEKRKPYIFLTKAAGAGKVETCADTKSAKALLDGDSEHLFRWVFVDDKELRKAEATLLPKGQGRKSKEIRVVGNAFLCQSLILGRLWEQQ